MSKVISDLGKQGKKAFADACAKRGKTMAQVIRILTDEYVREYRPRSPKGTSWLAHNKEDHGTARMRSENHSARSSATHTIC